MTPKPYYELRVFAPTRIADRVGELLFLAGAEGVAHEELGETVALSVGDHRKRALQSISRRALGALRAAGLDLKSELRAAPAQAWRGCRPSPLPVRVSSTLSIVPSELGGVPSPAVIVLEPAFAFGFGDHPTTRLAASEIERHCRKSAVASALDIGSGTGVLAILAALRGVPDVLGVDTDAVAVRAARRNARVNSVAKSCRFRPGSADSVRQKFELVVANLDYRTLLGLSGACARCVAPSGRLIVTGFLSKDAKDVAFVFGRHGFVEVRARREKGFSLLVLERPGRRPRATDSSAKAPRSRRPKARGNSRTTKSR